MSPQLKERTQMVTLVSEVVSRFLPRIPQDRITGDKDLKGLGADSVDRVEIILSLLDQLDLKEPLSSFSDLEDLDALIDFLIQRRS